MQISMTASVFSAIVLLSGGCTTNPATGRSQFDLLSTEEEIALGAQAAPELVAEYGGEVQSEELKSYVRGVGARMSALTEADYPDLPWEFFVLDSDVINAFAIPGGKVFISRGLLVHITSEAQLAGVLGHEIGHVVAQHVDERLSRTMAAQLGMEAIGGMTESQIVNVGVGFVGQTVLMGFDRNQESESDRLGLKYMVAAGYNPWGMVEMLQILVDTSEGAARPPEFLSTHPNPEGRRDAIAELINSNYGFASNNPDYGDFQQRWEQSVLPYLPASGDDSAVDDRRSDRRRSRRGGE